MIGYLEGTVRFEQVDWIIVMVGGLGYEIHTCGFYPGVGDDVSVHIYEVIREDAHMLYGFASLQDKYFFEKLVGINGIGPKLAQKMLNSYEKSVLVDSISKGDVSFLTGLPGIGKKTAQKIILELQGKLIIEEDSTSAKDVDVIDALVSLGYARKDIDAVLPSLEGDREEDRIRHALKLLS